MVKKIRENINKLKNYISDNFYIPYKVKKVYWFFRYDIWYGISNLFKFFKVIWSFRTWNYHYTLVIFKKCIDLSAKNMDKYSMHEGKEYYVKSMNRVSEILNSLLMDDYIERSEKELGLKVHSDFYIEDSKNHRGNYELKFNETEEQKESNSKIFKHSWNLESKEWKELFKLLEGRTNLKGSGLKSWWY